MHVEIIPCLKDNYAYLLTCPETHQRAVVDPSEAEPVLQALKGQKLDMILNTHHHWDHVGGNEALIKRFPELKIYGHSSDSARISGQNIYLEDGETFLLGQSIVEVIFNPGHTLGAVSYYLPDQAMVFTGDTLFLGGCGRIFEGTAAQMHHSINTRLAELPAQTQIYCGHEYTLNNLKFAAHMEPENTAIEREILRAQRLRNKGLPTVPGRIQWEKESNPFMRIHSPEILKKVLNVQLEATSEEAFGIVRELKNAF